MKVLTVCEPMASALIFGGKPIENRRRPIGHVGPLLIHAGLSLDWFTPEICAWAHDRWPACPASPVRAMHEFKSGLGSVIGLLYIHAPKAMELLTPAERRWATGPVCLPVSEPRTLPRFKVRGNRGVFELPGRDVPDAVHAAVDDLFQIAGERGW